MAKVAKSTDSSSLAEVVDRILDKGIVIDAWAKVSLVGIELLSVEARVVIASVENLPEVCRGYRSDSCCCRSRLIPVGDRPLLSGGLLCGPPLGRWRRRQRQEKSKEDHDGQIVGGYDAIIRGDPGAAW